MIRINRLTIFDKWLLVLLVLIIVRASTSQTAPNNIACRPFILDAKVTPHVATVRIGEASNSIIYKMTLIQPKRHQFHPNPEQTTST